MDEITESHTTPSLVSVSWVFCMFLRVVVLLHEGAAVVGPFEDDGLALEVRQLDFLALGCSASLNAGATVADGRRVGGRDEQRRRRQHRGCAAADCKTDADRD